MTADSTTYRELDQRSADGLEVTLEWNPATDALRVVVVDRESEGVTFPVSAADASDAFTHPFIYAGRAICEAAVMPRQTHHDERHLPKPAAARGMDRPHGGDGAMTRVGPIGRLGRYTSTHFRVVLVAWLLVAVVLGFFAPRVETALSGAGWETTGSQSVQARQLIDRNFHGLSSYGLMTVVSSPTKTRERPVVPGRDRRR